jgi:nucleoside recognition membrane protein YjiH
VLRFLLPSAAGVLVFLVPVVTDTRQTIVFSLITDALTAVLAPVLLEALYAVVAIAAFGSLLVRLRGEALGNRYLRAAFEIGDGWLLLRLAGFGVCSSVLFGLGPELVRLPDTGVVVMNEIGVPMLLIIVVGIVFLPLLTEYGLMEFVGGLLGRSFERVFRLPGRAAIDMSASLVSASSVGLIVTIGQYERGYYSVREASLIACSFSIVSVPFAVLVANVAGLERIFVVWYLIVIAVCLVCAALLARLPPLSRYPDSRVRDAPLPEQSGTPLALALARAEQGPGLRRYGELVAMNLATIVPGVIAPCMALATAAAVLVFHSPTFEWLAAPLAWLLSLLGVAEASAIAPGFIAGYLDQFMPALLAANVESEFWRFVLGGLAVAQLVFLSEFGVLILRSPLPVDLKDLTLVFLLRTLITAPLLCAGAWLVVG